MKEPIEQIEKELAALLKDSDNYPSFVFSELSQSVSKHDDFWAFVNLIPQRIRDLIDDRKSITEKLNETLSQLIIAERKLQSLEAANKSLQEENDRLVESRFKSDVAEMEMRKKMEDAEEKLAIAEEELGYAINILGSFAIPKTENRDAHLNWIQSHSVVVMGELNEALQKIREGK